MSNILSLIEACHEGKPVEVAEVFGKLIAERVANLIEDEKPVVVREFYENIQAGSLTEDDRYHKQSVGKDIGGGFKHVAGDRHPSEGNPVYAHLTTDQMVKHGIPHHKKPDYGSTVSIHHPKLGKFNVYQATYDPVTKKHTVAVRALHQIGSTEAPTPIEHTKHLANHLTHS